MIVRVRNSSFLFYPESLKNVSKKSENSWQCSCPCAWAHAHGDANPSLSLRVEGETLLAKCFRGCSFEEIISEFERLGVLVPDPQAKGQNPPAKGFAAPPPPRRETKKTLGEAELARYDAIRMRRHCRAYFLAKLNMLPCTFGAKSPMIPWRKYQLTPYNTHTLEGEIQKPLNLAVVCGEHWNLLVLDIDNPSLFAEHVLRPAGLSLKSFLRLCERSGAHIERTGKGFHLFFAHSQLPQGLLERRATLDAGGFEMLSKESESCVVAPSYHSSKKKFYRAVTPLERLKERKPMPPEVVELLTNTLEHVTLSEEEWHYPLPISEEVVLPPAPLGALPPLVREIAQEISTQLQVSEELAVSITLGTLSACVAGGWKVEPKTDWQEELALYLLAIARSGERKSKAFCEATKPIWLWEENYSKLAEKEAEQSEARLAAYEAKKKQLISEIAKQSLLTEGGRAKKQQLEAELQQLVAEKPVVQKPLRLIVQNATIEAVEQRLEDNGGLVLVLDDEPELLRVIVGGRYNSDSSRLARTTGALLKAHGGEPLVVDRRERSTRLRRAVVSLTTCIQPDVAIDFLRDGDLVASGFLARILYCWCPSRAGARVFCTDDMNPALKTRWSKLLYTLLDARIARFRTEPGRLILSPDAFDRFRRYHDDEAEPLLREGARLHQRAEWGTRLPGVVLRFAGIFQLVEDVESRQITIENLERGITFARFFMEHALFCFGQAGTPAQRLASKIAARIRKEKLASFTVRDVERWYTVSAADALEALKYLAEKGWLRADGRATEGRGRPSSQCLVNPLIFDSDTPKVPDNIDKNTKNEFCQICQIDSEPQNPQNPEDCVVVEKQTLDSEKVKQYETNSEDDDDPPPSPLSGRTQEESQKLDYLACELKKHISARGELRFASNTPGYAQLAYYLDELKSRVLPEFVLVQEKEVIVAKRALSEDDIEFIARAKEMWSTPKVLADALKTDVRAVKAAIAQLEAKHG
jgi:hypothetical protein